MLPIRHPTHGVRSTRATEREGAGQRGPQREAHPAAERGRKAQAHAPGQPDRRGGNSPATHNAGQQAMGAEPARTKPAALRRKAQARTQPHHQRTHRSKGHRKQSTPWGGPTNSTTHRHDPTRRSANSTSHPHPTPATTQAGQNSPHGAAPSEGSHRARQGTARHTHHTAARDTPRKRPQAEGHPLRARTQSTHTQDTTSTPDQDKAKAPPERQPTPKQSTHPHTPQPR